MNLFENTVTVYTHTHSEIESINCFCLSVKPRYFFVVIAPPSL